MRKKVKKIQIVDFSKTSRLKLLDRRFFLDKKCRIQNLFNSFYGMDRTSVFRLSGQLGVSFCLQSFRLPYYVWDNVERLVDMSYEIGRPVEKEVKSRIQELKKIGSYRGLRFSQGLPLRGQRTHTNARTMKRFYQRKVSLTKDGKGAKKKKK